MLSLHHLVLNREAAIAAELIANGATLIGRAHYGSPGLYGQAFFDLSLGFERAAKLIYIADYAMDNSGAFPSNKIIKDAIGHDLIQLFSHAEIVAAKRRKGKDYALRPATNIHNSIVEVLSDFARTTRYYNLDLVTGGKTARTAKIQ
jgi:hypothetical protein